MIRHTIMAQIAGLYTLFAAEHSGSVLEGYYYRFAVQQLHETANGNIQVLSSVMVFLFLDTYR